MGAKSSKIKITAEDRAILEMKLQRDKLEQYKKQLKIVIAREVEVAKEALRNDNKQKALRALKKKKFQEQLLQKADVNLNNVNELVGTIESARIEVDVMKSLKTGNEVLQAIHKEMSLEDVEKLMDDTADTIAYQNELDELLSGSLSLEDEEEVLEQLLELELESKLPQVPNVPLPVREQEPPEEQKDEGTHASSASVKAAEPKESMLAA